MSGKRRDHGVKISPRNIAGAEVIPLLPSYFHRENGEQFPPDLVGSTIVRFGAAPHHCHMEGGGLIIDYVPQGQTEPKRLALAFNELGMWIQTD